MVPGCATTGHVATTGEFGACARLRLWPLDAPLPKIDLRLATTRATNALLEHHLGRVLLITTEGFEEEGKERRQS